MDTTKGMGSQITAITVVCPECEKPFHIPLKDVEVPSPASLARITISFAIVQEEGMNYVNHCFEHDRETK